jgi:hypothetical protein
VKRAWAGVAAAWLAAGCATVAPPPTPEVVDRARALPSYTAELGVKLRGPDVRGPRVATIVGWKRPDRLRLEVPGPGGARLILVARDGRLTVVFPRQRAVLEAAATDRVIGTVLGVALAPSDVMDFLVGTPPARVSDYRAQWGAQLPKKIEGRLEDGTRLDVRVKEPEPGVSLQDRAFDPPPHDGYRTIDAAEARELWMR